MCPFEPPHTQTPRSTTEDTSENEEDVAAAIYARTSSSSQRFGYSIDEQISRCWERCKSENWTVKYVFSDEAESGRNTDRSQFQKLLQQAEAGQIDVVIFWKLDRFCRSLVDLIKTEEKLSEFGVSLQSVTEQIDTMTPVGRFNFRNLASAAELETDLTSQRVKMGMYGLAKEHKWPNEQPPLGYQREEDGTLQIDHEEADLIRKIFELYIDTKSMPEVAFRLADRGYETKSGDDWSRQSVKKILSNELYIGSYEVAGYEEYVDEYRIISDDLFELATEARYRFQSSKPPMNDTKKGEKSDRILKAYKNGVTQR